MFISADRSEGAFEDYFSSMPGFLALPYEQRQTAQALGERFGVRGYPTLVVSHTFNLLRVSLHLHIVAVSVCASAWDT